MKVDLDHEVDSRPALLRALFLKRPRQPRESLFMPTCHSTDQNTEVVAQQVASIEKSAVHADALSARSSENVIDVSVLVSDEDGSLSGNMTIKAYVFMRDSHTFSS